MRDPGVCWDLGPDMDCFSSRTRLALQHMNPNKINMELILELLEYLGNTDTLEPAQRISSLARAFLELKPELDC